MTATVACDQAACPCGRSAHAIDTWCDDCGKFLIRLERISLVTLVASALLGIVMFRTTDAVWPLYLLMAIGIVHLYAVVFSRGSALPAAALSFAIVTLTWAAWELLDRYHGSRFAPDRADELWQSLQSNPERVVYGLGFAAWLIATIWALALGRVSAIGGLKLASSYFLSLGAFVFGLWGFWGLIVQRQFVRGWVFEGITGVTLLAPLILLLALLATKRPQGTRPHILALWFFLASAYLTGTQLLTDLTRYVMGKFIPGLLDLPPVQHLELPRIVEILKWRQPVSGVLIFLSLISLLSSSAVLTSARFLAKKPGFYVSQIARVRAQREKASPAARSVLGLWGTMVELGRVAYNSAMFSREMAVNFVTETIRMLTTIYGYVVDIVRLLVLPVVTFSVLAAALTIVVRTISDYSMQRSPLRA